MKKIFYYNIVLIIFLCSYYANAKTIQEHLKIIDKQEFDFITGIRSLPSSVCYFNDLLYFIPKDQDIIANDTSLYVFYYSIENKELNSMIIKFPKEHLYWNLLIPEKERLEENISDEYFPEKYNFSISSFTILDKYLIVSGRDKFLVFIKNENNFSFLYVVNAEEIYGHKDEFCFPNLKIVNDTLLGYRCTTTDAGGFGGFSRFANNTVDSQLVSTAIMKYDLKNKKLINFKMIYPEPKGFGFLNFAPRQNIDCNGKYYIISDITEYNLYLYDTDWNLIDKISPNHKNWVQDKNLPNALTMASAYKHHPKTSIGLMDPFTHTTSLTHNILFKDIETILVNWSVPTGNKEERYKFFFDEYKIINGKLKLINTFERIELNKESEEAFGILGASALVIPEEYCIFENYLISISEEVPFDIFSTEIKNMSLKKYYEKLDDYYIDNPIKKSILIYKFK